MFMRKSCNILSGLRTATPGWPLSSSPTMGVLTAANDNAAPAFEPAGRRDRHVPFNPCRSRAAFFFCPDGRRLASPAIRLGAVSAPFQSERSRLPLSTLQMKCVILEKMALQGHNAGAGARQINFSAGFSYICNRQRDHFVLGRYERWKKRRRIF